MMPDEPNIPSQPLAGNGDRDDQTGALRPSPLSETSDSRAADARPKDVSPDVERLHADAKRENGRLSAEAEGALENLRDRAPRNLDAAIRRFRQYQREDPFPHIKPGLLSCSAFCAYIAEAGILYPYRLTSDAVQLASIDLRLIGRAVWFDENGDRKEKEIGENTPFLLRRNSIAFVTLEPYLQLPDYIAMRFNLRVRHVYRGLLLGTGPLIDPGYQGYLSIPLHNLTNNHYAFSGGERLVAVEFTKLDPDAVTRRSGTAVEGFMPSSGATQKFVIPFPEPRLPRPDPKVDHPIDQNFAKAGVYAVESSLPAFDKKIRGLTQTVTLAGLGALAAFFLTIVPVVWQATGEIRTIAGREQRTFEKLDSMNTLLTDSLRKVTAQTQVVEQAICAQAQVSDTVVPQIAALCR